LQLVTFTAKDAFFWPITQQISELAKNVLYRRDIFLMHYYPFSKAGTSNIVGSRSLYHDCGNSTSKGARRDCNNINDQHWQPHPHFN
jgi:hypothetical protein